MKKVNTFMTLLVVIAFCTSNAIAQKISGKGSIVSETISMSKINAIGLGIAAEVYIKAGNSQKIEVKGQKNIIEILNKKPDGNSWEIGFKRGYNVKSYEKLEIYITMPEIEALSIGGSGSIICEGKFKVRDDLALSIGGSGDIKLDADAEEVKCNIGGSGSIELSGSAEELKVSIGGSGDVKASNMKVNECEISSAGSGDIEINVTNRLNVSLVGSGDVRYKGSPKVSKSIVGSGSVRPI
jgi:hypothetical protein